MTTKQKRWFSNGRVISTAVIVALFTSAVNSGFIVRILSDGLQPLTRPDPYTATMARADSARLEERIVLLERRVTELERR